ncbi:MAG: hypothetical protein J6T47_06145, partial [Lachnospiraceae bacterium]|nr:hypothetical protein [Lachnospiraceae bacterium]
YNGDPNAFLDYDEWSITSGALKSGHTADYHCEAKDASQWKAINQIVSGGIKDEEGNAVDYQYKVEFLDGELEMTPRSVHLISGSATKWYDGTPLTNPNYTIKGDGVAEGDTLTTQCVGSIIEPGKLPNEFDTILITSERFGNVKKYYKIDQEEGILKVLLRVDEPANSNDSVYIGNGEGPEPIDDIPPEEGGIRFGDGGEEIELVTVEFDDSRYILPGAEDFDLTDPSGFYEDPTAESTIFVEDETASSGVFIDPTAESTIPVLDETASSGVSIDPTAESTIPVLDETASSPGVLDPTAESTIPVLDETASSPGFIDPTAESTIPGGGTTEDGPGESTEGDGGESTKDGAGESTEGDGGESTEDGGESTLPDGGETNRDNGNENPSDGKSVGGISEYSSPSFGFQNGQPKKVFSFYGYSNRIYYFKMFSYGIYNGYGFAKTPGEDAFKPWNEYLMGNAMLDCGYGYRDIVRVADLALENIVYPYYMTTDLTKSEDARLYTCETYFIWGGSSYPASSDSREKEYREFVYSNYLDVPANVKEKLAELGRQANLKEGDSDLIEKIADYIQNAASYSFKFNFPYNEDMVLYFLTKGKKGICQHYAAAATLMYRTYGIPARYVVGYATQGAPGRWTTMTTNDAHAWTEVYIDGSGWIPVEVTGEPQYEEDDSDGSGLDYGEGSGDGEDEPLSITIVYDRYKKVYDGRKGLPLTLQGHLFDGRLRDGDRLTMKPVVLEDEEMLQRVGDNYFEMTEDSIRITDPAGKDVTDQYMIDVYGARYIVEARPLSIIVYSDYDDDDRLWRMKRMQWSIADGSLAPGHTLEVYCEDKDVDSGFAYTLGNVGDYKICAQILDEEGNNVTYNYDLISPVMVDSGGEKKSDKNINYSSNYSIK